MAAVSTVSWYHVGDIGHYSYEGKNNTSTIIKVDVVVCKLSFHNLGERGKGVRSSTRNAEGQPCLYETILKNPKSKQNKKHKNQEHQI